MLPVAGQPLIEHQIRVAAACGAGHIVVLVERLPPALVKLFDRLRAEGIDVEIARSVRDATDRIHPDELVIVMAGGAVAPTGLLADFARECRAAILTVPEAQNTHHLERIDGASRWSGIAFIHGTILRHTSRMLGDWALAPTLLRTALQSGTSQAPVDGTWLIQNAEDARKATIGLLATPERSNGLFSRYVVAPVIEAMLPKLAAKNLPLRVFGFVPVGLLLLSAVLSALVSPTVGLCLLILAAFAHALARRLASPGGRSFRAIEFFSMARLPAFFAILVIIGWKIMSAGESWGAVAIAAWAGTTLLQLRIPKPAPLWVAEVEVYASLLLVSVLAGYPLVGLSIVLVVALVTQFLLARGKPEV